jgi:hypothetical protein
MPFPEWPSIISVSVVPVVIISACGLLSLAFYGRLAALVARLRTFQREMLREQEKWAKEGPGDHQQLLEVLRTQTLQVTERARLIRRALLFFLTTVAILILPWSRAGFFLPPLFWPRCSLWRACFRCSAASFPP